ncbi:Nn.00g068120.m01.CDS01 [Neocucurbitaria sp. VM-36]
MASSSSRRPYNGALIAVLLALAGVGAWFMRISPALNDAPVGFLDIVETSTLPNGTRLKKYYTGIGPLDDMLSFLVAAFLYGPTKWNEVFYWLQLHFLVQFAAPMAIMNVEACRERNRGSWLKYTAGFAFVYQNVGSAIIFPLWFILFYLVSAEKSYFSKGRAVPLPYARVLLPATIFLYAIPTIALFIPGSSISTIQNLLAFWQVTPILVNVPLWFASLFVSSARTAASKTRNADLSYLKSLYILVFVISVAAHWFTIYGVSTSTNPEVSLSAIFLPNASTWKTTLDNGLLWIFQWDWIIDAITFVLPAWIAVYDVQRLMYGAATSGQLIQAAIVIMVLTLLGGPGAAMSAVWAWREEKLAVIEKGSSSRKKRR